MLIQIDPQVPRAVHDVITADAPGKCFVFHLLAHGLRVHFRQRLPRFDQRHGSDESRQLIAGKQRLFHRAVASHARVFGV